MWLKDDWHQDVYDLFSGIWNWWLIDKVVSETDDL